MYLRPTSLDEAVRMLAETGGTILSGGTDLYPALVDKPLPERVIDLSAVTALRGISVGEAEIRIGGRTTWTDIVRADLPPAFAGLKAAAREVGSIQIQNAGTIGGNLCNGSPAADGVPPLLALGAEVELLSVQGVRRLPVGAFITGNRRTEKRCDEVLSAVIVPRRFERAEAVFLKLGARKYMVISIVMVAINVLRDASRRVVHARVAVGSASAVAQRLRTLEAKLEGAAPSIPLSSLVAAEDVAPLAPIDDIRASATYRFEAAATLVKRGLEALATGHA
jgi:CO/xanthine dehydrogenase FAD-binding subunit